MEKQQIWLIVNVWKQSLMTEDKEFDEANEQWLGLSIDV